MAVGGLSSFNFLKPETEDEFQLVLSMGSKALKRHGKKPSAQIKQRVQTEINQAIADSRGGAVAGNLSRTLGPHDFSQDLLVDPVAPDPTITNRIGTAENIYGIQTGRALEEANEPFGFGDVSTFDKIAGGAGLAAAILGATGVGGRGARGGLAAVSRFGLGRALSAPERFRKGQERTLRSELGQAQATRQASLGIPRAQLQQQELETTFNEDLFERGFKRSGRGLEADRLNLRGQENLTASRAGAAPSVDKIMAPFVKRAMDKMDAGQPLNDTDIQAIEYATRAIRDRTRPSASNVRRAGTELEDLRTEQRGRVGEELGAAEEFDYLPRVPSGRYKGSYEVPGDTTLLRNIATEARTGNLRLPGTREREFGTTGEGIAAFFGSDKDTLLANEPLARAADSARVLEGTTREDIIQQDPERFGVEASGTPLPTNAPGWATARGFRTIEEAEQFLNSELQSGSITQNAHSVGIRQLRQ